MTALDTSLEPTWWRRLLLWIVLVGLLGLLVELLLLEHFDSVLQWIPLAAFAVGILAVLLALVRPSPASIRFFQWLMAAYLLIGAAGIFLHLRGNYEFELEMEPDASGWSLWWEVLSGATPTMAPGAMAQLGLIGLLYAFRHPLLARPAAGTTEPPPA